MKKKKIARSALIIFISACILFFAGIFILNRLVQNKIRRQLTRLSPQIDIKVSSVHVNFFSSSATFNSLKVAIIPFKSHVNNRHSVDFSRVALRKISWFKLLLGKRLTAEELSLTNGTIQLDKFLVDQKDSAESAILSRIEWPFKELLISTVELNGIKVFLHSAGHDQPLAHGDVIIHEFRIDKPGDRPKIAAVDLRFSDVRYALQKSTFRIGELDINSRERTVRMESLRFYSTGKKYNEGQISVIKVTGFAPGDLINRQRLTAERVTIGKSAVMLNAGRGANWDLPFLKGVSIDILDCKELAVSFKTSTSSCNLNASMNLRRLTMDSLIEKPNFHFGSVSGNFSNVKYLTANYQNLEIKNIAFDSKNETIQLENLKVVPGLGKYQFARSLGHQADWLNAEISKIAIYKVNIHQLLHHKLFAETIEVGESRAYVFRDRRLPRAQKNVPLPVAYLKTLPFAIRVKQLRLSNCAIAYEEYPRNGYGQTGILEIKQIRASISPFTNYIVRSDPDYIKMKVSGSIMGSGTVNGTVLMPLRKSLPYRVKGAIERLQLTTLNSSSENLGRIRIKSGFLDFLSFDFTMTEQRSTGKIIGAYHGLVIEQLKKHTNEKNVANFASFMLRHLIIPLNKDKSLPERKRTGLVNYQRDPGRFVSHYFLQSLLMGVRKSFTLGFLLPK